MVNQCYTFQHYDIKQLFDFVPSKNRLHIADEKQ